MKNVLPFFAFVFALQSSPTRSINRAVFLMRDFNSHTLPLICFCVRQRIVKRIHFLFFPITQLSERAINSLENVLHTPGRCFNRWRCVCPGETGVICIQGQQSSRNYGVISANGCEESTRILFTLWHCSARWSDVQVKSKTLNNTHTYAGRLAVHIWGGGQNVTMINLLLDLIMLTAQASCRKWQPCILHIYLFLKRTQMDNGHLEIYTENVSFLFEWVKNI